MEKIGKFTFDDYRNYLIDNPFHKDLGINLDSYCWETCKITDPLHNVSPNLSDSFAADLEDLIHLHYLVTKRKSITILEFGVGKSTIVFDHALRKNYENYHDYVSTELRRFNLFECHSVDSSEKYIENTKKIAATTRVVYHHSSCITSTFNDRICTYYNNLPNICPDFIYLDAPDQYSPSGDIRGIHTRHQDRLPMAADILAIEHFLLPGTLIAVDGRVANARFLKENLQRNWTFRHFEKLDQCFFELTEPQLGDSNKKQLDFQLGEEFFDRIIT